MKIAFLTETGSGGKYNKNHPNARTEVAWCIAMDADTFPINYYSSVIGYDHVFVTIPKGDVFLNMVGVPLKEGKNSISDLLASNFTEILKKNNGKIYFIQEGPTNLINDYSIVDQINYHNHLHNFDIIFAHNYYDTLWYKGMFPGKQVEVMPSLMLEHLLTDVKWTPENKTIIGGNFASWYGGFQSYMISDEFKDCEKWTIDSHCKRPNEDSIPDLHHLPRFLWLDWMKALSKFKYAIHLMPTVAAGTFALNNAYFGIPCIGNENVDTQLLCFPDLTVDVRDIEQARKLANKLYTDKKFYENCSENAKRSYNYYYGIDAWKKYIFYLLDKKETALEIKSEENNDITAVFTSCGRFDLLKRTFDSFIKNADLPIKKIIVIDNSTKPDAYKEIDNILKNKNLDYSIIINEENIGQVSSIDKAYSYVNTSLIFHSEDDWEFFNYGFLSKSLEVLKENPKYTNINVRVRFDGERGSMHPISPEKITKSGVIYHEYETNYLGAWHGFSWNPGLRRLKDYKEIGSSYKKYGEESGVGKEYYNRGYKSACLKEFYCRHIGQNSITEKRNM